ncbi:hypothetical protein DNTS_001355 [Danionella cerebrum]|uniref:Rhodanese domain-containing protein n=1 Tax=Danionella cerebrum TaxID=2873325 RepID=A0A553Q3W8_9TELE|nr:hypothetical protein DNTS_001355 [Danionella translucida]
MILNMYSRLTRTFVRVLASRSAIYVVKLPTSTSSWTLLRYLHNVPAVCYGDILLRNFSSSSQTSINVSYESLKKLLVSGTTVVIDVREPWELREYGTIQGSINVPLGQVNGALQLQPEEFIEKYGGEMPSKSQNIVFSCLAGVRSKQALDTAVSLGYTKVQHFSGGWKEWAERELIQSDK